MAKPVVDGLERELGDRMQVLRVSVMDDVGSQLAARYSVRSVPTSVLLDGSGEVVLRQVGTPQREDVEAALAALSGG
ncbi:MAG: thioredoxin family protein [Anaerolineales bacterium]|nr:thioredoxin family protein [Anaerolineales bacterium]